MAPSIDFPTAVERVKSGQDIRTATDELLQQLTDQEKLDMLHGDPPFWKGMLDLYSDEYSRRPYVLGSIDRLGIPGIRYCDGPRGVNIQTATAFPCSTARGATWDPSLEEQVAAAIGLEARASGANTVGAVCVNLPRHPAWGRAQETYGEDPVALGGFGAAGVRGLQRNVMACVKHFALNSMETARFRADVQVADDALHEVYLPHFWRCAVGAGAGAYAVMTAYNSVNGEWAGESGALVRGILRGQWGYEGITISDWLFGVRDGVKSVKAGLDVEAPFRNRRLAALRPALDSGEIQWREIDRIAGRILRNQISFYASRDTPEPGPDVVFCEEHRRLAREVAARAIVLLKNERVEVDDGDDQPLLPLPESLRSCALIGRHADSPVTGDRASSWVDCPEVVTPYQGLARRLPDTLINLSASDDIEAAVAAAKKSSVAILVVGYDGDDEGEFLRPTAARDRDAIALLPKPDGSPEAEAVQKARARARAAVPNTTVNSQGRPENDLASRPAGGDRKSVRLRREDVDLIRAVSAANPRTVVTITTAGAIIASEWLPLVPSVLVSWYNGCEGGGALADVLTGAADASGRLPWSMPRSEEHLPPPFFDGDEDVVVYDKWFGQRRLDRMGAPAEFPLGWGISYTRFELGGARVTSPRLSPSLALHISVDVTNAGARPGWCVVQVYARHDLGPGEHDFPGRVLVGFKAEEIKAGEVRRVDVVASLEPLRRWVGGRLVLDARSVDFEVGRHAGDVEGLTCHYELSRPSM